MGGLPWDVAARDLPVPEAISQRRAALGIPQATPRAQEAPPQAAKRGQGQACGDGQTAPDTQDQSTKRSKSVYNIISTQGWVGSSCIAIVELGVRIARAKPVKHQLDHGQLDERFRRQDALLSVLAQAAALAQPGEGPLDRPPDRQLDPSLGALGAAYDRQIPSRVRLDPLVEVEVMILRVGVHPHDLAHRLAVEPGEQRGGRRRVVDGGGRHQHGQQQAQAVDHDMTFPAVDVLGIVAAPLLAPGGRVDRLTVDARRRSGVVGLLHRADLAAKEVVELLQGPVSSPLVEVTPDGALGWEVHGQIAPLAAGAEDVEDGVEDVPYVGLAGPSAGVDRRDVRLDQGPLCVGDVAGIMVRSHPISTSLEPLLFPLWDRLLVANYGANTKDLESVEKALTGFGLTVVSKSEATHSVQVSGPVSAMEKAFGVKLSRVRHDNRFYRGRVGSVHIPAELDGIVTDVFGLDTRPMVKHKRPRHGKASSSLPPASSRAWFTPQELADAYQFPAGDGTGQTIAILEFGGK